MQESMKEVAKERATADKDKETAAAHDELSQVAEDLEEEHMEEDDAVEDDWPTFMISQKRAWLPMSSNM